MRSQNAFIKANETWPKRGLKEVYRNACEMWYGNACSFRERISIVADRVSRVWQRPCGYALSRLANSCELMYKRTASQEPRS